MKPGTADLLILIFIFICLQLWWIIPLINIKNKQNISGNDLKEEIRKLEKLFKK